MVEVVPPVQVDEGVVAGFALAARRVAGDRWLSLVRLLVVSMKWLFNW